MTCPLQYCYPNVKSLDPAGRNRGVVPILTEGGDPQITRDGELLGTRETVM